MPTGSGTTGDGREGRATGPPWAGACQPRRVGGRCGRRSMSSRFTDYDAFAPAYNRHWGPRAGDTQLPLLHELLLARLPAHAAILDLCCGSGHLAHLLTAEGYDVTGLDGSEELLNFARWNAAKAVFVLADARSFTLPTRYDAAVCLSDSLNHLLTLAELVATFQNVCAVLREGGLFLL